MIKFILLTNSSSALISWTIYSFCLLFKINRFLARSFASNSHSSELKKFKLFRSRLHRSLKRSFWRHRLRLPTTNLLMLYNRDFGNRSLTILKTWPSQRSLHWLKVKYMVVRLVRLNTFFMVIFCCNAILRIRRRNNRSKVLIFFSVHAWQRPCFATV